FRNYITYPLLRRLLRNKPLLGEIDIKETHSVLILRYDKIGDMIVTGPVFRVLKSRNPHLRVGVIASPINQAIIEHDPHVDERYVIGSNPLRTLIEILRARRARYEVVLNLVFNRTTSGAILANVIAPGGMKVGQGDVRYAFYYNKLLQLPRMQHPMTEVLATYLEEVFGFRIKKAELNLSLNVPPASRYRVDQFLTRHGLKKKCFAVVNLSVGEEIRKLTKAQYISAIKVLRTAGKLPVVLISIASEHKVARELAESSSAVRFPDSGSASLLEVAALIEMARIVISPETSIVHFAAATKTPVVALYSSQKLDGEWVPFRVPHRMVTAPGNSPASHIASLAIEKATKDLLADTRRSR
ncbi:MAG: putative ADP-heptose:LPS heptosyltransferase, partial [Bacteroidetes bacterium]|nr:putative ADP-heptose:LPS heptosyltransferase [Bacteroidota bacterium]